MIFMYFNQGWTKLLIMIWVGLSAVESYVIQLFAPLLKQWDF